MVCYRAVSVARVKSVFLSPSNALSFSLIQVQTIELSLSHSWRFSFVCCLAISVAPSEKCICVAF